MTEPTTKSRCNANVRSSVWRSRQCARPAWRDGFCQQHHPDTVFQRQQDAKAQHERRMAAFYARINQQDAARAVLLAARTLPDELVALLQAHAAGENLATAIKHYRSLTAPTT